VEAHVKTRGIIGIGVGMALWAAAPASAAQIGIEESGLTPGAFNQARTVRVVAASGEVNDVEVRVNRYTQAGVVKEGTPFAAFASDMVTVKDHTATFSRTPPSGDAPCRIIDPHTARCTVAAPEYIVQTHITLGDGNDRLSFAPGSLPLHEQFFTGDGDDDVATGPFVGDASYRNASSTGAGDDHVLIGPSAMGVQGLAVGTGLGDDTVEALNGAKDLVDCEDGLDTLIGDPWDSETIDPTGPPVSSCENRPLPAVPLPAPLG
jgi:hypothetical protein